MRVLLVSDLHYVLPQLDWVVERADEFEAVVIAGDLLDVSGVVPLEAQSVVALRYLDLLRDRTTVLVGSGNHDLTGPDAAGEQAALWLGVARQAGIAADGASWLVGDVLFTVCPWWDGPVGRRALEEQLEHDAARRPARWVWVYHWPPHVSATCWTGSRYYGDADLTAWIERFSPDIVLAGHVHEPPFKPDGAWADRLGATWVFNAGRQIGPVPTHVELDLGAGVATWRSLLGVEQVELAAPERSARSVF